MDQTLADGLVAQANRMYELLTRYQYDRNSEHLVECAGIGCSLLQNKIYTQALVSDVRRFQETAVLNSAEVHTAMGDHFGLFLRAETTLLREAHMDSRLIKVIEQYCEEAQEGVRPGELNADKFRVALEDLRDRVCDVLGDQPDAKQLPQDWRRLAQACLKVAIHP